MAPTIHIIRHARAAHQDENQLGIHDPELTFSGIRECEALAADMAKLGSIDLVLCSPMKRSIQTAIAAFPSYTQSKQIILLPDLQESGIGRSNTCSSQEELVNRFGSAILDYSFLTPDWTKKGPGTRYDPRASAARSRATRLFIRAIAQHHRATNANIVVITHSFYIGYLLTHGDFTMFKNVEYRSFRFDQIIGGDGEAHLHELPCSITRRLQLNIEARRNVTNSLFSVPVPTAAEAEVLAKQEKDDRERPIGCSVSDTHEVYCPRFGVQIPTPYNGQQMAFDGQQGPYHTQPGTYGMHQMPISSSNSSAGSVSGRGGLPGIEQAPALYSGLHESIKIPPCGDTSSILGPPLKSLQEPSMDTFSKAWDSYMQQKTAAGTEATMLD
ncbi:histidine phosphatase superfamily [Nemania diffusa]|nr:histidine phosphatase superfamily [Nemania diffusa]